jgi:PhzF family phenazine biosynthesis protein
MRAITQLQIYQVNAFAEGVYRGNPAAVCLLPGNRDVSFYRGVACIMDCSETAFVFKEGNDYRLRWFSPNGTEVDLCGHATLAAASIMYDQGLADPSLPVRFQTKSGLLTAALDGDFITLDFPAEEVMGLDGDKYGLDEAMGVRSTYTGRTRFDAFIVVGDEAEVKRLTPDFDRLKQVPGRGVIVTAASSHPKYDFASRFFCPKIGINEDPVTGSAHCALGVYWGYVMGKDTLVGYQASPEGGIVRVKLSGDRVHLSGRTQAVAVPVDRQQAVLTL